MKQRTVYEWNSIYLRKAKFYNFLAKICVFFFAHQMAQRLINKENEYLKIVKANLK